MSLLKNFATVGGATATRPSRTNVPYRWPCPPVTAWALVRSAATCQKVTIGHQRISGNTSEPRGSANQSGSSKSRSGDHHTIGSDGCCR